MTRRVFLNLAPALPLLAATAATGCSPRKPTTTPPAATGDAPPPAPAADTAAPALRPFATFERSIWREGEVFVADVRVANDGPADISASVLTVMNGRAMSESRTDEVTLKRGALTRVCTFYGPDGDGALGSDEGRPDRLELSIVILGAAGARLAAWNGEIWAFPNHIDDEIDEAFRRALLTASPATAADALAAGRDALLLCAAQAGADAPVAASAAPPAVVCNPAHPLFNGGRFPCAARAVEPWRNLSTRTVPTPPAALAGSTALATAEMPDGSRAPLIFEARVSGARLLAIRVPENALRTLPEGRHLLLCAAEYMRADAFAPTRALDIAAVRALPAR